MSDLLTLEECVHWLTGAAFSLMNTMPKVSDKLESVAASIRHHIETEEGSKAKIADWRTCGDCDALGYSITDDGNGEPMQMKCDTCGGRGEVPATEQPVTVCNQLECVWTKHSELGGFWQSECSTLTSHNPPHALVMAKCPSCKRPIKEVDNG